MGTRVELVLVGDDETLLRAAGEEALEEVALCERRLSLFRRDSVVSQLNRDAHEQPVRVDRDMFELLLACQRLHELSAGAFDPTVGGLMRRYGFRGEVSDAPCAVGMEHVQLDASASTVRFGVPGLSLDLGGVGKGVALEQAGNVLRDAGVESALLHAGTSTVVAIGAPPGRAAWDVAMAIDDRDEPGPVLHLRDAALSVSARRGRVEGEAGHVMDPRTGRPVTGQTTVAVVAPDAGIADAWSTAVLVAGDRPAQMPADLLTMIVRPRDAAAGPRTSHASQEVVA